MKLTKDQIKSLLRERGLRATGPRLAVVNSVAAQSQPVSHSQLVKVMADADMDAATIYRNLTRLTEVGLLRVVSRAHGMARYELTVGRSDETHDHAHFVCSDCDTVSCLPEEVVPEPKVDSRWAASLSEAKLLVQGTCPDCLDG
jgi:Fur family ferric uptake transcriptional regulator